MERFAVTIQTAVAGAFCGLMSIDLAFDLPVIVRGSQDDLLRAHSYYHHLRGTSHMPIVTTSMIAVTGVTMIYTLYRRVTWRRLLGFACLGTSGLYFIALSGAAPYFVRTVEPAEDALLLPQLTRDILNGHLTTIANGHLLLLSICTINILLLATEKPVVIIRQKVN